MIEQGSDQWHSSRGGMLTASMIYRIMSGTKGLETVRDEIRAWRKTGKAPTGFGGSLATEWGNRYEAQARASACLETGIDFRTCGSFVHERFLYASASPDGFHDDTRTGLELKCPYEPANHLSYVTANAIPKAYWWQMQMGMWITGSERWLFASFDPRRLNAALPMHTILHWQERSESAMRAFDERIPWFWSTV